MAVVNDRGSSVKGIGQAKWSNRRKRMIELADGRRSWNYAESASEISVDRVEDASATP